MPVTTLPVTSAPTAPTSSSSPTATTTSTSAPDLTTVAQAMEKAWQARRRPQHTGPLHRV